VTTSNSPSTRGGRAAHKPASSGPTNGWSPLDDYRAARRDGAFVATAERLSRDAVLALCKCGNCAAKNQTPAPAVIPGRQPTGAGSAPPNGPERHPAPGKPQCEETPSMSTPTPGPNQPLGPGPMPPDSSVDPGSN